MYQPRYYYRQPLQHELECSSTGKQAKAAAAEDTDMWGSLLGVSLCLLLLLIIVFSVAYPLTMYRDSPPQPSYQYTEDNWWCYHCLEGSPTYCRSKCW